MHGTRSTTDGVRGLLTGVLGRAHSSFCVTSQIQSREAGRRDWERCYIYSIAPTAFWDKPKGRVAFNGTLMVFDVIPNQVHMDRQVQRREMPRTSARTRNASRTRDLSWFRGSSQESALMFLQNVTKGIEGSPETEAGADNLRYIKDMVGRLCPSCAATIPSICLECKA